MSRVVKLFFIEQLLAIMSLLSGIQRPSLYFSRSSSQFLCLDPARWAWSIILDEISSEQVSQENFSLRSLLLDLKSTAFWWALEVKCCRPFPLLSTGTQQVSQQKDIVFSIEYLSLFSIWIFWIFIKLREKANIWIN